MALSKAATPHGLPAAQFEQLVCPTMRGLGTARRMVGMSSLAGSSYQRSFDLTLIPTLMVV